MPPLPWIGSAMTAATVLRRRHSSSAAKLFGSAAGVDLLVEEFGYRCVVECDGNDRASLSHQSHVVDTKQVPRGSDPESADFGRTAISEKEQLGPGGRGKPQLSPAAGPYPRLSRTP